jgi:hypothetical protein
MNPQPNYQKMFAIIDEVFSTRNDPSQLQVDEEVMKKLAAIHPSTMGEVADEKGPLIWVLLIPTSIQVMDEFISGKISEREILEKTQPGQNYDCIYLCSVSTLKEMREKGETKKLCLDQIKSICKDHPVKYLYVWAFSDAGERLAESLSAASGIELKKRIE